MGHRRVNSRMQYVPPLTSSNLVVRFTHVEPRETDINQLLRVEGPVPVPASADGLGDEHAGRVGCLPDAVQVHPSGHLLRVMREVGNKI